MRELTVLKIIERLVGGEFGGESLFKVTGKVAIFSIRKLCKWVHTVRKHQDLAHCCNASTEISGSRSVAFPAADH